MSRKCYMMVSTMFCTTYLSATNAPQSMDLAPFLH